MILTCPECATSYFVDDSRIQPGGRVVKCTSCGARWTATKELETAAPIAPPRPPPDPEPFVPAETDDLEVAPIEPAFAKPARAVRAGAKGEAAGKIAIWAVMGVIVVTLIGGAIAFRAEVVRLWPASQAAFAGLGLKVNALGLVIEGVSAKPVFQGGRPVLAVTGAIRSVRDAETEAPAIRINLLDRAGKPVAAKVATPLDARVPGHATRHFAIAIVDPPASVHELEVTFEAAAKGAPARGAAPVHATVSPASDPPAPAEAQPLPPGSRDALPQHD